MPNYLCISAYTHLCFSLIPSGGCNKINRIFIEMAQPNRIGESKASGIWRERCRPIRWDAVNGLCNTWLVSIHACDSRFPALLVLNL